jgi:hypothetical protein
MEPALWILKFCKRLEMVLVPKEALTSRTVPESIHNQLPIKQLAFLQIRHTRHWMVAIRGRKRRSRISLALLNSLLLSFRKAWVLGAEDARTHKDHLYGDESFTLPWDLPQCIQ